jgi:phosphoenolpyruvate-protein phosphotransferase
MNRIRPGSRRSSSEDHRLIGIAISEGVAIGPAFGAAEPPAIVTRRRIQATAIAAEHRRLDTAVAQSCKQLAKLRTRLAVLPEDSQAELAPLLDAYLQMLGPSRLTRGIARRIGDLLVSAETAVLDEAEAIAGAVLASAGRHASEERQASLARQAEEVREIGRRVIRNLTRQPFRNFTALPPGAVLLCEHLRPADVALLDPSRLAGVVTEEGGADGHTAIMLRALGIPAVFGVGRLVRQATPGTLLVVDGSAGEVVLAPSAPALAPARRAVAAFARQRQRLARLRRLPARTADGEVVELQANLEIPAELPLIGQAGATGVGLLRSEFLFMNREDLPDEDEQSELYRGIIEAMAGDPVTIRVLDWGGEKEIEALSAAGLVPEIAAPNPAFGLRGIRLLLRHPPLLRTQLRAILRAASAGPVRILLPMITLAAEVSESRAIYLRLLAEMRAGGERLPDPAPPLGIMIETPAAALSARALAETADFFAIGSNDLAMYTLAVDRSEHAVAGLYDALHPAVLALLAGTVQAALEAGKPVSLCGEMAGNPRLTPLLLGLGLRSFSMNAAAVPRVKQQVRGVRLDACTALARAVLAASEPAAIRGLLEAFHAVG